MPNDGVQISALVGARRVRLRDPADRDVERVDLIVVRSVIERDREEVVGTVDAVLAEEVDGYLLVIARAVVSEGDGVAHHAELLPEGRAPIDAGDHRVGERGWLA